MIAHTDRDILSGLLYGGGEIRALVAELLVQIAYDRVGDGFVQGVVGGFGDVGVDGYIA